MPQTPILFLSDSPSLKTGLGRITRDLAVHVASLPEFRVGTLGRGGLGSSKLPFAQYTVPETDPTWSRTAIEMTWKDFAGSQEGIVMTIWDASRLLWFTHPPEEDAFLRDAPFKRWGYFPIDSSGPRDRITRSCAATIAGFDRILAYTAWGAQVIERSIGKPVEWIPHGYDADKFQPRDRTAGRFALNVDEHDTLIGCNMTNQARKDWGTAFATIAGLRAKLRNVKFWVHTDLLDRYWSIEALAEDFEVADCVSLTYAGSKTDKEMSYLYSACDLTILPAAEGFGFPLVESMACGVPVLHGNYGGGVELIPRGHWLVPPRCYRLDTPFNALRPCFEPGDWVDATLKVLDEKPEVEECTTAVEHLKWSALWPSVWKKYFLDGLA